MKALVTGVSGTCRAGKTFVGLASVVLALGVAGLAAPARAACDDPPKPRVDWRGCDKSGANLKGANLDSADLTSVNFSNADLSGAALHGADLSGVTWSNTTCPDGTNTDTNGDGTCVGHL